MFTLIFQHFHKGFKTNYFKIFLSASSLLDFIQLNYSFENLLYTKELKHWMVPLEISDLKKFLSSTSLYLVDKNDEEDINNEFEFYLIDKEKMEEYEDEIKEKNDLLFYDSFNFEKMFFEFKLPENYFIRIVCKFIKPGEDNVKCDYFKESEVNDITIFQNLDGVYNERISTEHYVFRKNREMDDLYFYWSEEDFDINFTIPVYQLDSNCESEKLKLNKEVMYYLSVLEIALWIIKNTTEGKNSNSVVWRFIENASYNEVLKNLTFETLFDDSIKVNEAIIECCGEEDKVDLINCIKRKKRYESKV
jgi:hypothetical protein